MNKKLPISTDYIQQADIASQVRFSVFGRESMVRTFMSLVSEYPSRCLADDTNNIAPNNFSPKNIVPNNTSAKQRYAFPTLMQAPVPLITGLLNCVWRDS
jgi:hypothetical protein